VIRNEINFVDRLIVRKVGLLNETKPKIF